jgi:hypothetical protein
MPVCVDNSLGSVRAALCAMSSELMMLTLAGSLRAPPESAWR